MENQYALIANQTKQVHYLKNTAIIVIIAIPLLV